MLESGLICTMYLSLLIVFEPINCIPQYNNLCLLGVTFQSNCKFSSHIKLKLTKANKCLQYNQAEIDLLFKAIVLPNLTHGLSVYGASEPDLNIVQNFLDRCHKHRYISIPMNIKELLYRQDRRLLDTVNGFEQHPLNAIMPQRKYDHYNLRQKRCLVPKINTERFNFL